MMQAPIQPEQVQEFRERSRQLVRAFGLLQGRVDGVGCTPAQCHALIEVGKHGQLTAKEAAGLLQVDKSTASRALQALVKGGFLEAAVDPDDGRAKPLRLNAKGRKGLKHIHTRADAQVVRALSFLSDEERGVALEGVRLYERALRRANSLEGIVVRPIRAADQRAMAQIVRSALTEFGAVGSGCSIHDDEVDTLHRAYRGSDRAYFVAERSSAGENNSEILAGAGFGPLAGDDTGTICELRKMFALPPARGLGIGRWLLKTCLEAAREAGYERCYLETLEHMHRARALYQKLGFEPLDGPLGDTGHFACNAWYAVDL